MIAAADHLLKDKHPVFDNPRKWGEPGIWEAPHFDRAGYQKKINDICGVNVHGQPVVRLVWGWESRYPIHTEWDATGRPVKSAWRQRYRFMTVTVDEDEVDISVPRWILEQRVEPELLAASWEASRWVFDPDLGRRKDLRGELPKGGEYYYLRTISAHDDEESCCDRAWRDHRRRCWGYYRLPEDRDLELLREAVRLRDADPMRRTARESLTQEELEEIDRLAYATDATIERKQSKIITEGLGDWLRCHGWRAFTDDPSVLKHGKWRSAFPLKIKQ